MTTAVRVSANLVRVARLMSAFKTSSCHAGISRPSCSSQSDVSEFSLLVLTRQREALLSTAASFTITSGHKNIMVVKY